VLDLMNLGVCVGLNVPSYIQFIPFGTNGQDDTFEMRVIGWRVTTDSTPLYIPELLVELAVTLGNISGTAIAANTVMADTIVVNEGPSDGPFMSVISTADDTSASIAVHTRGCSLLEFDWDLAGAQEAVSMNAYYTFLN
jgi:hypothetical protein